MIFINWIKWLVYSNVWVALNVVAFYLFVIEVTDLQYDWLYALLIFLSTLFAYNFQRFLKNSGSSERKMYSERHHWINEHQLLTQVLSVTGFLGMVVISLVLLPVDLILWSIPSLIIVVFYTRRSSESIALRNLPFVKIFLISFVWLFVVLIVPFFLFDPSLKQLPKELSAMVFFFVFILCIPFDIRDIRLDEGKIKTVPILLGVFQSKLLATILMVLIAIWGCYSECYAMTIVSVSVVPSLLLTSENRSELFFAGWIEGQFVLLWLSQLLVSLV